MDGTTVLGWIKSGKLKSYRTPGAHNRILKDDLWTFIREYGLPFLGPDSPPDSSKKKILLVDDEPNFLKMIKTGLSREADWIVETAGDSLEAGLKVGAWRPALLVLDLNMPGFDGIDFCRFLKKNFNYETLPVIIVTGQQRTETEKNGVLDLGIFAYLEKPFTLEALIQEVRRFFVRHDPDNGADVHSVT